MTWNWGTWYLDRGPGRGGCICGCCAGKLAISPGPLAPSPLCAPLAPKLCGPKRLNPLFPDPFSSALPRPPPSPDHTTLANTQFRRCQHNWLRPRDGCFSRLASPACNSPTVASNLSDRVVTVVRTFIDIRAPLGIRGASVPCALRPFPPSPLGTTISAPYDMRLSFTTVHSS